MEFHWARNAGERHYSGCGDRNARGFANDKARLPDEARFFHQDCPRRRKKPLAVAARFVLACVSGHLDDFPYREFVHNGGACAEVSHPQLQMEDYGGNRGANVVIRCPSCGAKRNISRAMGRPPSSSAVAGDASRKAKRRAVTSPVTGACPLAGCMIPTKRNATPGPFRERYRSAP